MFILDCSVMIAACFSDESAEYADRVLDSLSRQTALVPVLWIYEIGNTLLVAERKKRIQLAQRIQYLNLMAQLPVQVCPSPTVSQLSALISLAQDLGLSLYDASYLDLAIQHKLPLASLDLRLLAAAQSSGVSKYLGLT